jgi:hypothetical protein
VVETDDTKTRSYDIFVLSTSTAVADHARLVRLTRQGNQAFVVMRASGRWGNRQGMMPMKFRCLFSPADPIEGRQNNVEVGLADLGTWRDRVCSLHYGVPDSIS